jgi:hypothetical protein
VGQEVLVFGDPKILPLFAEKRGRLDPLFTGEPKQTPLAVFE